MDSAATVADPLHLPWERQDTSQRDESRAQHAKASANSKIYIFRIDGEGEHQHRLQNIHSDSTRHNPTRWPAAIRPRAIVTAYVALSRRANILQSTFVFTLSVKPKNKYFAIRTRTRWARDAVERSIRPDAAYFQSMFVFTLSVKQENKYFAISTRTGKKTPGWGQARGSIRKLKDIYFSV